MAGRTKRLVKKGKKISKKAIKKSKHISKKILKQTYDNKWLLFAVFVMITFLIMEFPSISSRFSYAETLLGLAASSDLPYIAVPESVSYSASEISGFIISDSEPCFYQGEVIVLVFGKENHEWSQNAENYTLSVIAEGNFSAYLESWNIDELPSGRELLFETYVPSKNYPVIIVGCKYVKVGLSGSEEIIKNSIAEAISAVVQ